MTIRASSTIKPDLRLWAKRDGLSQPLPLLAHLLSTAACAEVLWDHWLRPGLRDLLTEALAPDDPEKAKRLVMAIAASHDLGKANPVFQTQHYSGSTGDWVKDFRTELKAAGYSVPTNETRRDIDQIGRHEYITLCCFTDNLDDGLAEINSDVIATIVGGHHGRWLPRENESKVRAVRDVSWVRQQDAHLSYILSSLNLAPEELPTRFHGEDGAVAVILLTGIVILADWLASHEKAVEQDAKILDSHSIDGKKWLQERGQWFQRFVRDTVGIYSSMANPKQDILGEYVASDLQSAIGQAENGLREGLVLVTYPTGDGKTEAVLLRNELDGSPMTFGLPTISTATALMRRIESAYRNSSNLGALTHTLARLDPFYVEQAENIVTGDAENNRNGLTPSAWLSSAKRQALAPVAVATVDQVLAGALRQKWVALRLLALANRHVVLDEVHTFDYYQSQLLADLLVWWGETRTKVTLLSATMPTWQQKFFVESYNCDAELAETAVRFPALTVVAPPTGRKNREIVKVVSGKARFEYELNLNLTRSLNSVSFAVKWATDKQREFPLARIALIVNTIERCQKIAAKLRETGLDVLVLHSRMTAGHREEVSRQLTLAAQVGSNNESGFIVVGTQVLEASLDLDFDLMFSDLAPVTSVVQRAGRLWRFNDPNRTNRIPGQVRNLVVHAEIETDGELAKSGVRPYLRLQLQRAMRTIEKTLVLNVPTGLQAFVDDGSASLVDVVASIDPGRDEYLRWVDRRLQKSDEVRINLAKMLCDPTYFRLVTLTSPNEDIAPVTRFDDYESKTFILLDTSGAIPGSTEYSLSVLANALSKDILRSALTATIPASGKVMKSLERGHEDTIAAANCSPWTPKSSLLTELLPVDIRLVPELVYDQEIGLQYA